MFRKKQTEEEKIQKEKEKEEKKVQDEIQQKVLGIYESKGPIYGMGATGAIAIFTGGGLAFALDSSFSDPKLVMAILLVVIGALLASIAAILYHLGKKREAAMRNLIIDRVMAKGEDKLLEKLVDRFLLRERL